MYVCVPCEPGILRNWRQFCSGCLDLSPGVRKSSKCFSGELDADLKFLKNYSNWILDFEHSTYKSRMPLVFCLFFFLTYMTKIVHEYHAERSPFFVVPSTLLSLFCY